MPKRIANHLIILGRDGKQVVVNPGDLFDFTADELKEIAESNKASATAPFRKPVDESKTDAPAPATTKPATGGKVKTADATSPAPDGGAEGGTATDDGGL